MSNRVKFKVTSNGNLDEAVASTSCGVSVCCVSAHECTHNIYKMFLHDLPCIHTYYHSFGSANLCSYDLVLSLDGSSYT